MADDKPGFLAELKRRNVLRATVLYAGAVWALAQGISQLGPAFGLSNGVTRWFVVACVIGLPFWVAFAWFYELTPQGVKRESEVALDAPARRSNARLLDFAIIGVMAVAIGLLAWRLTAVQHAKASTRAVASIVKPTKATAPAPVPRPVTARPIPAKSVAVLPFQNLSADKNNAYFADGMQDLILTKLAEIGDLKVISRTATEKYKSHPADLPSIGQQLGVATFLEGSVQKADNQVLINVQLIDAKTDAHIWAQSYQRTLNNIFGVEGEVATQVAQSLNAKLTLAEKHAIAKVPTHNKQALDAFLKGTYYMDHETATLDVTELEKGVALLEQATRLDPDFADAFGALSLAYQHLGGHLPQAEAAAKRALALKPDDPEAHRMVAYVLMYQRKFAAAIVQAQAAVRLAPENAIIANGLGNVYSAAGSLDKAAATYRHALSLDPTQNFIRANLGSVLMQQHRYADALDVFRAATIRDPSSILAAINLAQVQILGWGNLAAARQALQGVMAPIASSGALSDAWYWLDLYARDYPAALAVIQQAPPSWFEQQVYALSLYQAQVYRAQGDRQRARQAFSQVRANLGAGIAKASKNAELSANLSLALAGLGDADGAIAEALRAVKLAGINSYEQCLLNVAVVEAWTGRTDLALKQLDKLLDKPSGDVTSVSLLKLDPTWDSIRKTPAFQVLLKKYVKDKPTVIPVAPASGAPTAAMP